MVFELRRMAAEGFTGAEIAAAIGAPSRSAVLGKCMRIGVTLGVGPKRWTWTAERDARLRELWPTTLNTTQIAADFGRSPSSRGIISARAGELGLPKRSCSPIPLKPHVTLAVVSTNTAPDAQREPVAAKEPLPPPTSVRFLDRRPGQCVWPLWQHGEPLETKFVCGNHTIAGASYCHGCAERSYVPFILKARKAA